MGKFELRYDFTRNRQPPRFVKEDNRDYEYFELVLDRTEMMRWLRAIYEKRRATGFAVRLIHFVARCLGETPESVIEELSSISLPKGRDKVKRRGRI